MLKIHILFGVLVAKHYICNTIFSIINIMNNLTTSNSITYAMYGITADGRHVVVTGANEQRLLYRTVSPAFCKKAFGPIVFEYMKSLSPNRVVLAVFEKHEISGVYTVDILTRPSKSGVFTHFSLRNIMVTFSPVSKAPKFRYNGDMSKQIHKFLNGVSRVARNISLDL